MLDCSACTFELVFIPLFQGGEASPQSDLTLKPMSHEAYHTSWPRISSSVSCPLPHPWVFFFLFLLCLCFSATLIPPMPSNISTSRFFPFISPTYSPTRYVNFIETSKHICFTKLFWKALMYTVNVFQKLRSGLFIDQQAQNYHMWKLSCFGAWLSFSSWLAFFQWVSSPQQIPVLPIELEYTLHSDAARLVSTCLWIGSGGFLSLHTCHLLVTQNQNITTLITLPEAARLYFKRGDIPKCS